MLKRNTKLGRIGDGRIKKKNLCKGVIQVTTAICFATAWDTSQKFGISGFCRNFLQKYCDSLKRDSIFWRGSQTVLGDYRQIRFSSVFFG
jgi:hypothetical protein